MKNTGTRTAGEIFILPVKVLLPVLWDFAVQEGLIDLDERLVDAFRGVFQTTRMKI